ncbi:helix-turn-helix domain-containing protein [Streptomyces erythrochromogenes]|uniref:helix-turn-helix domain-containing protein n=1 Tax=Streptomyces erythrochromogenes TaxID=285574 RepID=UPI00225412EE|nr:helix-turn-helix transcriptional regulator [Streptomyces erythrochromogenes]MCX5587529.1 helix-turn-helix domain-containing protein [Streptomyces erythrochromogenes]
MPAPDDDHTGSRIQEQRRLARLSQRELADRIPYSLSLLNQVECGARAATPGFVAAVAQALRVDTSLLTGPPAVTSLPPDRLVALVAPIREALDRYDLGPLPELPAVRAVPELSAAADALCQQVRATHLRAAAKALPGLILELTHTAWTAPSTPAWQALASAYRTAHDVALKLDHPDLARVALDRMGWAAGRASDPCLEAVQRYKRATLWRCATSVPLITSGQALLAGATSREALAVTGQLHLGAATVAAKNEDRTAVETHLAAARELANRVGGEAGEVHWLSFGRANVRLHEIGTSIVMSDFDEALGRARGLKLPASTLTSRRARYLVDRALVEMEAGSAKTSLRYLAQARKVAPEQTRHLPGTRTTIRGLVHMSRRAPDGLGGMARWIGL